MKRKINQLVNFLGGAAGLVGLIFLFFQWKIGATLLIIYYLSASVSMLLMDNSVPKSASKEVANLVKKTVAKSKRGGVISIAIGIGLIYIVWFYF